MLLPIPRSLKSYCRPTILGHSMDNDAVCARCGQTLPRSPHYVTVTFWRPGLPQGFSSYATSFVR
jgi:hypothetical protein